MLTETASQWNTSFGAPSIQPSPPAAAPAQASSLSVASSGGVSPSLQEMHAVQGQLRPGAQLPLPPYASAQAQTFVTPAMWQESVASVYEGGLKRAWDYDAHLPVKRH